MTFFAFDDAVFIARPMPCTPAGDVVAKHLTPTLARDCATALEALYMLGYFNEYTTMDEARRIIKQCGCVKWERARQASEVSGWPPPGHSEIMK